MSGRTMISGTINTEELAVKAEALDVIEVNGEQYARLPEGWPAAEAKDLEEAHASAVMADEVDDGLTDREREIYRLSPEEVKELLTEYVDMANELVALRKGMKTMQRKTRKQNQVQRRLERRLAQARSRRDALIADTEAAGTAYAYMKSLEEMAAGKGVVVREGK